MSLDTKMTYNSLQQPAGTILKGVFKVINWPLQSPDVNAIKLPLIISYDWYGNKNVQLVGDKNERILKIENTVPESSHLLSNKKLFFEHQFRHVDKKKYCVLELNEHVSETEHLKLSVFYDKESDKFILKESPDLNNIRLDSEYLFCVGGGSRVCCFTNKVFIFLF